MYHTHQPLTLNVGLLWNNPIPAVTESPFATSKVSATLAAQLRNPNPYAVANTFAHELAHVIQGGYSWPGNPWQKLTGRIPKQPPGMGNK